MALSSRGVGLMRLLAVAGTGVPAVLGTSISPAAGALPPGCSQSGATVNCTETFTSGSNAFTLPAGVASIHVVAIGGEGGTGAYTAAVGGSGAEVTGDVTVTPGSTLYAVVGSNANGETPGGNGGGAVTGSPGGAGGGASDVRTVADDLTSRLIVAGGGGGAGGDGSAPFATPGDGGSAGGQPGIAASDPTYGGGPGGGATTSSGGAGGGGAGGLNCFSIPPDASTFCPFPARGGAPGAIGTGGAGGAPGGFNVTNLGGSYTSPGGAGGGGGGGWFGGGGGGGGESGAGGGGGGSNLVPPGGSEAVDTTGSPMVQVSYSYVPQAIAGQPPAPTTSAPATSTVVAPKVSIATRRARYARGRISVRLACVGPAGGACSGTLKLTMRMKRTVNGHIARVTIVLCSARYVIKSGSSALVTLKLNHTGRALIAHAPARTISVRASASVQRGQTARGMITIVRARRPSPVGLTAAIS